MSRLTITRFALIAVGLAALIALSALIAACSSAPQATPTPTRTPRPAGGAQATAAPHAQPTAMPLPLPTAAPTATPLPPTTTPVPTLAPTATPATPYERGANINPLTGLKVADPKTLARRPLMVVINNDPVARAMHYGFGEADVVYEYIMEGRGVTRYTAIFLANESERIGPLRSGRLVNFYLTPQYGGALAVSGAGGDVNWWLTFKMPAPYLSIDLNDPSNTVYSWSVGSLGEYQTRLQTNTARLRKWLADIKKEDYPKLRGFAFAETAPAGAPGKTASIAFPTTVTWSYDAASGRYQRALNGAAHLDAATGKQLSAANVVIQTVPHEATTYVEDSLGTTSIRIVTVGEGPVTILRDGVAIKGTWRAGDATTPEFLDATGKPIALKPGNTWFELIAPGDSVTLN